MQFKDTSHNRRWIKSGDHKLQVGDCLARLKKSGLVELVPDVSIQDESGMECEATFRHVSGLYLLYARSGENEQLDIAILDKQYSPGYAALMIRELRNVGFGDLISVTGL